MRKIKAALLSALVIPGLGQLYMGRRLKGGIIIGLVNLFLLGAFALALRGMGKIMVARTISNSTDLQGVLEKVRTDSPVARWLLAAFLGLWLYGVVDALFGKDNKGDYD